MSSISGFLKLNHKPTSGDCVASHLLLWAIYEPPVVVLDLLQLVKLHADVVDGELQ